MDEPAKSKTKDAKKAAGGRARAAAMTPEERSKIAAKAAAARWDLPKATHAGVLPLGEIPCFVLESGERVLSTRGIMKALGRTWRGRKYTGTELPVFLEAANLKPFILSDLSLVLSPVLFRTENGQRAEGFRAEILPAVCEVYLRARDAEATTAGQKQVVRNCEILVRGLARVGIIALVDEATGYQYDRARHELAVILEQYIAKELLPWVSRFPDEFFKQVYRLQGWEYHEKPSRHPRYVGKLINRYVYDQLPDGVLEELRRRNPANDGGRRRHKHHQHLTTDTGIPHLDKQLTAVVTLMRVSDDKAGFEELFDRAFGKQMRLKGESPTDQP